MRHIILAMPVAVMLSGAVRTSEPGMKVAMGPTSAAAMTNAPKLGGRLNTRTRRLGSRATSVLFINKLIQKLRLPQRTPTFMEFL